MTFLIARYMGPTWGPSGASRFQVGPMLAPWTLLSGISATSDTKAYRNSFMKPHRSVTIPMYGRSNLIHIAVVSIHSVGTRLNWLQSKAFPPPAVILLWTTGGFSLQISSNLNSKCNTAVVMYCNSFAIFRIVIYEFSRFCPTRFSYDL